MNLDHDFFQVSKLSEDQKKGLHLKKENFVSQILVETCAQMHTKVKLLGGCRQARSQDLEKGVFCFIYFSLTRV